MQKGFLSIITGCVMPKVYLWHMTPEKYSAKKVADKVLMFTIGVTAPEC